MPFFHGECSCQGVLKTGRACTQKAYFSDPRIKAACGRHSNKQTRRKLEKNPETIRAQKEAYRQHANTVTTAMSFNKARNQKGKVHVSKLKGAFAVKTPQKTGFQSILPNYANKTRNVRADGALNMHTLSPKTIGPVNHGQPGLPPALTIENFHQGSKRFITQTHAEFKVTQLAMFQDPVPHRHHPEAKKVPGAKNRNIPKYFVWIDQQEKEHCVDYITCRQFYCHFMSRAVIHIPEFKTLLEMKKNGYNLLLCGYDANEIINDHPEKHTELYLDDACPYGHEMVLHAMLTLPESEWPWTKHKTFDF